MASPATLGEGHCKSSSLMASSPAERLNLKATELRLGLPGSQSPDRDDELNNKQEPGKFDEKPLFPLLPSSDGICSSLKTSGNKRGFLYTMDRFLETKDSKVTEAKDWIFNTPKSDSHANVKGKHVEAKAQVVGWPPIRSFRKNTLTSTTKVTDEVDGKPGTGSLFVKVSMDGAPYLRKLDLRKYSSYRQLSSGLEKMFCCFTKECVVTYEDKDGDWMLVGDVPWDMFIETCKRLKIMKGSNAIGLAPRAM